MCGATLPTVLDSGNEVQSTIPRSFLGRLSEPPVLTPCDAVYPRGWDGTTSSTASASCTVTLGIHVLATITREREAVPEVFERQQVITFLVVDGVDSDHERLIVGLDDLHTSKPLGQLLIYSLDPTSLVSFDLAPGARRSLGELQASATPLPVEENFCTVLADVAGADESSLHGVFRDAPHAETVDDDEPDEVPPVLLPLAGPATAASQAAVLSSPVPSAHPALTSLLHAHDKLFGDIPPPSQSRLPMLKIAVKPDAEPRRSGLHRRVAPKFNVRFIALMLKLMLIGVVERTIPQARSWILPHVIVLKDKHDPDGKIRATLDMTDVNAACLPGERVPLPSVATFHERFRGCALFTDLDLADWYWQFRLDPASRDFCCFPLPHDFPGGGGFARYVSAPQGWMSLPDRAAEAFRAQVMDAIALATAISRTNTAGAYVDNVTLGTRPVPDSSGNVDFTEGTECYRLTVEEHMRFLRLVFKILDDNNIRLRLDKCRFMGFESVTLGVIFNGETVSADPDRLRGFTSMRVPAQPAAQWLRRVLGTFNYYRGFVCGATVDASMTAAHTFMSCMGSLQDLLTPALPPGKASPRVGIPIPWTAMHTQAFHTVIKLITSATSRATIDYSKEIYLRTDASDIGWATTLWQFNAAGLPMPVMIISGRFTDTQRRYKVNERECFALVTAIRQLGSLLHYANWVLQTDHNNLRYMASSRDPIIQRWWFEICHSRPSCVQHIPGAACVVADAASRDESAPMPPDFGFDTPLLLTMARGYGFTIAAMRDTAPSPGAARPPTARVAAAAQARLKYDAWFDHLHALNTAAKSNSGARTRPAPGLVSGDDDAHPAQTGADDTQALTQVLMDTPAAIAALPGELELVADAHDTTHDPAPLPADGASVLFTGNAWLTRLAHATALSDSSELSQFLSSDRRYKWLEIDDGRRIIECDGKPVIPPWASDMIHDALINAHERSGHPGTERTLSNLSYVFMVNKHKHAHEHAQACPVCQVAKAPPGITHQGSMLVTQRGSRPYGRVIIDFVGPLEAATDGSLYIFTLTCAFTRFLHARATRDCTAESAVTAFRDIMDYDRGQPLVVQVDGAGSFKSGFASMLHERGIALHVTHAHDARSNAISERQHKIIADMIRTMLPPAARGLWPTLLKAIVFFCNTYGNRMIKMSPHEALFGYRASSADVPLPLVGSELVVDIEAWRTLCNALRERASIADATSAFLERTYLDRALSPSTAYAAGDLVLVSNPARAHKGVAPVTGPWVITTGGRPSPSRGPFWRAARIGPDGTPSPVDEEFHARRLRPYYANRDPTGAIAAAIDTPVNEYVVRDVVAHKTDSAQPEPDECSCERTHLRWRVSWQGKSSEHDTWEPPSFLTKLKPFKEYNTSRRGLTAHAAAQAKCEREHPARVL